MKESVLNFLEKLVSFQTISTDKSKEKEILACVDFLKDFLLKNKFKVKIVGKERPLILAYKFVSSKTKTIGIYSHYDIQPPDPLEKWHSDPFKLTIKNNKIYGRGTADDKGHLVQNIFSVLELIQENNLKNNIVFIFEGEEEVGSFNISKYLEKAKEILKNVDFFVITDVEMIKKNVPTVYYGLRGIVYFEIEVWTGKKDLHSGEYGNLVYNPSQILFELFTKMRDLKGKIKIPGFYRKVRKVSEEEKSMLFKNSEKLKELKKASEVYAFNPLDEKYPTISAMIYPSLEINSFYSGYTKEGSKTIIPNYALVKFSFRLVEYQEPEEIIKLVKNFVKDSIPRSIKFNLKVLASTKPFHTDLNSPYLVQISQILESHFKNSCVFVRSGGSIPIAEMFMSRFKKPVILTGFILPDSNLHSPNENIDLNLFFEGIKALKKVYGWDYNSKIVV